MKIAIASDHAGFEYKERLRVFLIHAGHDVTDFGTGSAEPVDYPLFIRPAVLAVAAGTCDRAIVLGGSGNGEAIVANRTPGIRCSLCWNQQTAIWGRQHNNANALALGQRTITYEEAEAIVQTWLTTGFAGGRHARRIEQIDNP